MKLLDSTVIIDFLNGKSNAVTIVETYKNDLATTTINQFEVLFGIYKQRQRSQDELVNYHEFRFRSTRGVTTGG